MCPNPRPLRIGLVAGEASGDILGGGLLQALHEQGLAFHAEGIGGPRMLAQGMHSHYPMEWLSVMGLVEVLASYPRLKSCHTALTRHFLAHPPDVFVGVDAPDFTLPMEQRLRAAGIPTVHYVSPTVWAWREGRLKKIARACDHMLTLFPFEADFYRQHGIPVTFTGHPLAQTFPLNPPSPGEARKMLGISHDPENPWIALLPGSRVSEIQRLLPPFLDAARLIIQQHPNARFLLPAATPKIRALIEQAAPPPQVHLLDGQAPTALAAADVVLTASGTATLEAMLAKKPMVVGYRLAPITYWIAKHLVRTRFIALPNILAQEALVPECIQHQAQPKHLAREVLAWLENPGKVKTLQTRFRDIHQQLQADANQRAARMVVELAGRKFS